MTTFQHLVPLFHLCLLFLVVRAQSAVLTWFGLSFHPFGLLKVLCPSVRQVRCIFYFFAILHLCLSFWMGRCENHGPSRGRVENRICSLRMQRGKKVGERDGWMKGGSVGLHLMWGPSKASLGIKADHGQPDASSPCQPQGIYPSACFWKNPSSCCFFSPNFCFFTQLIWRFIASTT